MKKVEITGLVILLIIEKSIEVSNYNCRFVFLFSVWIALASYIL